MLISKNWLKEYLDLPAVSPEELALKMTMGIVEVDAIHKQGENLENIVIGKITSVEKHPNADKLRVCKVDIGTEVLNIVCGGSNVAEGMKIALAKIGAKVKWHGEGDLIELKPVAIRGVDSQGMICASAEIGLAEMYPAKDEREILDLSFVKAKPGTLLAEALSLNDIILEVDNKSMNHRPDMWGHYGMAREVAAAYNKKLKPYKTEEIKSGKEISLKVEVEDTKLCPRYMAVAVSGIKIGPSPEWLQKRLSSVGLRPINNIVDITNYIMYDLGQPMHAFDARQVASDKEQGTNIKINVRKAKKNEKFTTLDGREHELSDSVLVIADEEKAVALAGVMGGANSEIKDDTTTIIFESANFEPATVRRAALKLDCRSESSARFEKSQDPNNCELALKKAVQLALEFCPGAYASSSAVDEKDFYLNQGPIELPLELLNKKIGMDIEKKTVVKILESLGFEVETKKNVLSVKIPTWRATKDISITEDLVEEVARMYGYDNIKTVLPVFPIQPPEENKQRKLERKLNDLLVRQFSFAEIYNYSFVSPIWLRNVGISEEEIAKHIELANPIAKDRPLLRKSLLPNLIWNIDQNFRKQDKLAIVEIGKVFDIEQSGQRLAENSDELLPRQDVMLGLAFLEKGNEIPFYNLSNVVKTVLEEMSFSVSFRVGEQILEKHIHPGRQAEVLIDVEVVGKIFELHPKIQKALGIESRVALAEINTCQLLEKWLEKSKYRPITEFPEMQRDVAFVVEKKVEHQKIVDSLKNADTLITKVELFDVYQGNNLPAGKKSMAYHIIYQASDRTLKSEEVDAIQKKIFALLEKDFAAEIRK